MCLARIAPSADRSCGGVFCWQSPSAAGPRSRTVPAMAGAPGAALRALGLLFFSYATNGGTFVSVLNYYTEDFVNSIFQ